jgi:hypothetical protein
MKYPMTPDGRYFVVDGRLWRRSNPMLDKTERDRLVNELMQARRAIHDAQSTEERTRARKEVDRVKRALGERGPVWWNDGAPDFNCRMVENTPYAVWFAQVQSAKAANSN